MIKVSAVEPTVANKFKFEVTTDKICLQTDDQSVVTLILNHLANVNVPQTTLAKSVARRQYRKRASVKQTSVNWTHEENLYLIDKLNSLPKTLMKDRFLRERHTAIAIKVRQSAIKQNYKHKLGRGFLDKYAEEIKQTINAG